MAKANGKNEAGAMVSVKIPSTFKVRIPKADADFVFKVAECQDPEAAIAYFIQYGVFIRLDRCTANIPSDDPDLVGKSRTAVAESLGRVYAGKATMRGARIDEAVKIIRGLIIQAFPDVEAKSLRTWADVEAVVGAEKIPALKEHAEGILAEARKRQNAIAALL